MALANTPEELAREVLAGDRRALARAITLLESERKQDQALGDALLERLLPRAGGARRVGFSGPPGAGKSTLIDAFGRAVLERGERVAVLAIDPSSRKTGGSILGDKTRMARLAASEQAFIRPSPSRGEHGGIAPRTREAVIACEAAGYDWVLVETVGVGQAEIEIADLVDCLIVLLAWGAGDELQGMKRGLLEHGDLFVVGKADGDGRERARKSAAELASALSFTARKPPEVLTLSAFDEEEVRALLESVLRYLDGARASDELELRRRAQAGAWFERAVERGLRQRLLSDPELERREQELAAAVAAGSLAPSRAARELLDALEARLRREA